MKVAVIGAGGGGGDFGPKLQLAGNDVQFVARGAHLRALQTAGLTLLSDGPTQHLPAVAVTDDLRDLSDRELVLVTVKSWDTDTVAAQLAQVISPATVVLSLQNGVLARSV